MPRGLRGRIQAPAFHRSPEPKSGDPLCGKSLGFAGPRFCALQQRTLQDEQPRFHRPDGAIMPHVFLPLSATTRLDFASHAIHTHTHSRRLYTRPRQRIGKLHHRPQRALGYGQILLFPLSPWLRRRAFVGHKDFRVCPSSPPLSWKYNGGVHRANTFVPNIIMHGIRCLAEQLMPPSYNAPMHSKEMCASQLSRFIVNTKH